MQRPPSDKSRTQGEISFRRSIRGLGTSKRYYDTSLTVTAVRGVRSIVRFFVYPRLSRGRASKRVLWRPCPVRGIWDVFSSDVTCVL